MLKIFHDISVKSHINHDTDIIIILASADHVFSFTCMNYFSYPHFSINLTAIFVVVFVGQQLFPCHVVK